MAGQEKKLVEQQPEEIDIVRFLKSNPTFFERHQDTLLSLSLPHTNGKAVSLIEKQVAILREKNRALEIKLSKLIQRARDNEALSLRMQKLALALMETDSLMTLAMVVRDLLVHEFEISSVALQIISWPGIDFAGVEDELLISAAEADLLFTDLFQGQKPVCGNLKKKQKDFLFGGSAEQIKSIALIPLHSGCNFGLLALGSQDGYRFQATVGTHFLNQVGELISARLKTWLAPI